MLCTSATFGAKSKRNRPAGLFKTVTLRHIVGIVFAFATDPVKDQKRRYGVFGDSYVSVVEFSPSVKARSVLVFGQSGDPHSPTLFRSGFALRSWRASHRT